MPIAKRTIEPYWTSSCGRAVVYLGDCREVMSRLTPDTFHSVVTDVPYELSFMGRKWDSTGIAYSVSMWERVCRVAKPGAHLLSFGGTRTWHRIVCAIEDAGFDIRDTVMWVFGSGMPKSHDISKAIDKEAGVVREVVGSRSKLDSFGPAANNKVYGGGPDHGGVQLITTPTTDAAKQWAGWGSALKPAFEPIILARRPLEEDTLAKNTLTHACGGLNIDGCRVPAEKATGWGGATVCGAQGVTWNWSNCGLRKDGEARPVDGRWPANFMHDGSSEVTELFPESNGSAARFFYSPKADSTDRVYAGSTAHPTVKPLDLMKYLVRLVTVRGGIVLDPFMGSGSAGVAAIIEGMHFVGIEQDESYAKIAVGRLQEMLGEHPTVYRAPISERRVVRDTPPPPQRLD